MDKFLFLEKRDFSEYENFFKDKTIESFTNDGKIKKLKKANGKTEEGKSNYIPYDMLVINLPSLNKNIAMHFNIKTGMFNSNGTINLDYCKKIDAGFIKFCFYRDGFECQETCKHTNVCIVIKEFLTSFLLSSMSSNEIVHPFTELLYKSLQYEVKVFQDTTEIMCYSNHFIEKGKGMFHLTYRNEKLFLVGNDVRLTMGMNIIPINSKLPSNLAMIVVINNKLSGCLDQEATITNGNLHCNAKMDITVNGDFGYIRTHSSTIKMNSIEFLNVVTFNIDRFKESTFLIRKETELAIQLLMKLYNYSPCLTSFETYDPILDNSSNKFSISKVKKQIILDYELFYNEFIKTFVTNEKVDDEIINDINNLIIATCTDISTLIEKFNYFLFFYKACKKIMDSFFKNNPDNSNYITLISLYNKCFDFLTSSLINVEKFLVWHRSNRLFSYVGPLNTTIKAEDISQTVSSIINSRNKQFLGHSYQVNTIKIFDPNFICFFYPIKFNLNFDKSLHDSFVWFKPAFWHESKMENFIKFLEDRNLEIRKVIVKDLDEDLYGSLYKTDNDKAWVKYWKSYLFSDCKKTVSIIIGCQDVPATAKALEIFRKDNSEIWTKNVLHRSDSINEAIKNINDFTDNSYFSNKNTDNKKRTFQEISEGKKIF